MVRYPPGQDREASPDLAVGTVNWDALMRSISQGLKDEFEYAQKCVGIDLSLEFVCCGGLGELGRNGQ